MVYNSAIIDGHALECLVRDRFEQRTRFLALPQQTSGAAETLLCGLDCLVSARRLLSGAVESGPSDVRYPELAGRLVVSWDGDLIYRDINVVECYRQIVHAAIAKGASRPGACVAFNYEGAKGRFSYVAVEKDSQISAIDTHTKISDWANTGTYCFPDGSLLADACVARLALGDKQLQIADVIGSMLPGSEECPAANALFELIPVCKSQFHNLSTANDSWNESPRAAAAVVK